WEQITMSGFDDPVKDLYRSLTTIEDLQDHWREANERAAKIYCYKKNHRDTSRICDFRELIRRKLVTTKKWLWAEAHPPTPPPPKIEIDLPKEWFAEDKAEPAKSIKETLQKLAPNAGLILEEWLP